jgi:hypothetical protein
MIYLENNWEKSDRPNNHYIADLVGHFYLSHVFNYPKRAKKTCFKILKQVEHQVHDDGTSYEGSTAYHRLVTELFWLFYLLCKVKNIELPKNFHEKLKKMFLFLQDCEINQIGDNDSGKIVTGLSIKSPPRGDFLSHYRDFGLTIIKNKDFYITFRHPTYKNRQPTGHFHDDVLAITLTYKNIPILVDPGTGFYTSNREIRNVLRSFQSHSTFFTPEERYVNNNLDLFQMRKEIQNDTSIIKENKQNIFVENYYKNRKRRLIVEKSNNIIEICDCGMIPPTVGKEQKYIWSFIFHPLIKIKKIDSYLWEIYFENKKLFNFTSSIDLKKETCFYSEHYYSCIESTKLVGHTPHKLNRATELLSKFRFASERSSSSSKIRIP